MRSEDVPGEDFDMENSILTVLGANFWFQSGNIECTNIYIYIYVYIYIYIHADF